jgi:hypothetical protein
MEDRTEIAGIILLYLISLSIITALKGRKYDAIKKRENSKYDKDHFGGIMGGSFHISIPIIIKEETTNIELNEIIKQYNRLTRVFWISVTISIPIFFWVY